MTHSARALTAVLAALPLSLVAAAHSSPQPSQATPRTREVYVSVVDRNDQAVAGLTAADFAVREDGTLREVLKAEPASEAMQIVLLIDDSAAADHAIQDLRGALSAFVARMQGKAEIGLVTIGERPTSLTEPTKNLEQVKKGISRIFARPGSGAYFLEALDDVARGIPRREVKRPVIIALITEGIEFSSLDSRSVLDRLYASGATLHVLSIGRPSDSMTDEVRNRNIVVADGTSHTGGRREQILIENAIPDKLMKLADELLHQYVVTYGVPDALIPPETVSVSVKRPDLKARARTRLLIKPAKK